MEFCQFEKVGTLFMWMYEWNLHSRSANEAKKRPEMEQMRIKRVIRREVSAEFAVNQGLFRTVHKYGFDFL